jgi:predicted transcriptional regulator
VKNLKRLRRDAGLTQHALSKAAGIHRWRIAHAERGMIELTDDENQSIRKILLKVSRKNSARVLRSCSGLTETDEEAAHARGRLRSARTSV